METFCVLTRQRTEKLGLQTHKTEQLFKSNSQTTVKTKAWKVWGFWLLQGQQDAQLPGFCPGVEKAHAYLPW